MERPARLYNCCCVNRNRFFCDILEELTYNAKYICNNTKLRIYILLCIILSSIIIYSICFNYIENSNQIEKINCCAACFGPYSNITDHCNKYCNNPIIQDGKCLAIKTEKTDIYIMSVVAMIMSIICYVISVKLLSNISKTLRLNDYYEEGGEPMSMRNVKCFVSIVIILLCMFQIGVMLFGVDRSHDFYKDLITGCCSNCSGNNKQKYCFPYCYYDASQYNNECEFHNINFDKTPFAFVIITTCVGFLSPLYIHI